MKNISAATKSSLTRKCVSTRVPLGSLANLIFADTIRENTRYHFIKLRIWVRHRRKLKVPAFRIWRTHLMWVALSLFLHHFIVEQYLYFRIRRSKMLWRKIHLMMRMGELMTMTLVRISWSKLRRKRRFQRRQRQSRTLERRNVKYILCFTFVVLRQRHAFCCYTGTMVSERPAASRRTSPFTVIYWPLVYRALWQQ